MSNFADSYQKATQYFLSTISTLKEEDLDRQDAEGWSPRQVIHHVADSEAQSYARLRRLIAEPGTIIQGYDEAKWAENETLGYNELDIEDSIAVFKAVRQSSHEMIKRLSEEQLENAGTHSESGRYTIQNWLESYTNHPVDHAHQINNQLVITEKQ